MLKKDLKIATSLKMRIQTLPALKRMVVFGLRPGGMPVQSQI